MYPPPPKTALLHKPSRTVLKTLVCAEPTVVTAAAQENDSGTNYWDSSWVRLLEESYSSLPSSSSLLHVPDRERSEGNSRESINLRSDFIQGKNKTVYSMH